MRRSLAPLLLAFLLSTCGMTAPALAQHNHSRGHDDYKDWFSRKASNGCCNNDDCGHLTGDDLRETSSGPQVKIEGQWCPILQEHYTTKGQSPDASVPHACVGKNSYWLSQPPCDRLLCFMGQGGT